MRAENNRNAQKSLANWQAKVPLLLDAIADYGLEFFHQLVYTDLPLFVNQRVKDGVLFEHLLLVRHENGKKPSTAVLHLSSESGASSASGQPCLMNFFEMNGTTKSDVASP